jgi:hypothetical protein
VSPKRVRVKAEAQSYRVIEALGNWCSAKPGRRFMVEYAPDGWRVALDSRESSTGQDLLDALSLIATVASLEVG